MSQLQDLARILTSAAVDLNPTEGMSLLHISGNTLVSKKWTSGTYGEEELIASDARADAPAAAFFTTPDKRIVVYVSSSSLIRAVQFDKDEEEWNEVEPLPHLEVLQNGQVAAGVDRNGQMGVFYQDSLGDLVYLDDKWNPSVLPPVSIKAGSPLATLFVGDDLSVAFVSKNGGIHTLTRDNKGVWLEKELTQQLMVDGIIRFMPVPAEGNVVYVLTDKRTMYKISGKGVTAEEMGYVDDSGTYVAKTSAESVFAVGYSSCFPNWKRRPDGTWYIEPLPPWLVA